VFERLTEKGKQYTESHHRRLHYYKTVDAHDGSKLFAPRITANPNPNPRAPDQSTISNAHLASVDEFLYQDAKDRELRLQQKSQEYEEQLAQSANSSKMNELSQQLLQQRADKQVRKLFTSIDKKHQNVFYYEELFEFLQSSSCLAHLATKQSVHVTQLCWKVFNHFQENSIHLDDFIITCKAFLLHKSFSSVRSYIKNREQRRIEEMLDESGQGVYAARDTTLESLKKSEVEEFKRLLK
jgi:hypothetical protein